MCSGYLVCICHWVAPQAGKSSQEDAPVLTFGFESIAQMQRAPGCCSCLWGVLADEEEKGDKKESLSAIIFTLTNLHCRWVNMIKPSYCKGECLKLFNFVLLLALTILLDLFPSLRFSIVVGKGMQVPTKSHAAHFFSKQFSEPNSLVG